jgi:hypothetical protein
MKIIEGNILNIETGIIVHQVNTLQFANRGLAKQIREKYPRWYKHYKFINEPKLSEIDFWWESFYPPLIIFSIFAQDGINFTNSEALRIGLKGLFSFNSNKNFPIYIPWKIDCRFGGGDWSIIYPIIQKEIPMAILVKFKE